MKTLSDPATQQSIIDRLQQVRSDSPRAWGKMSAHQMICHLSDSFRLVLGEKPASSVETFFKRTVMKWAALSLPIPWPHGTPTMPEVDQELGGTPPVDFEKDRQEVVSLTERFAGQPAWLATAKHPFFGKMSVGEWMRWAYLHMDHHLRQFNC
jgi:hypothetical protein